MRLSVATKIFMAFTAMLVTFGAVLLFNLYQMRALYEEVEVIHGGLSPLSLALSDIKSDLRTYNVLLSEREWPVLRSTLRATQQHYDFPQQVDIKLDRVQGHVRRLLQGPLDAKDRAFLEQVQRDLQEARVLNAEFGAQSDQFIQAVLGERYDEAETRQAELRRMARRLETRVRVPQQQVRQEVDAALLRAQRGERRSLGGAVGLSLVALLISAGIMWVTHATLRPLRKVTEGARRIGGGDYQPVVELGGSDELAILSREFNRMVARLADREEALREQAARLVKSERLAAVGELATKVTHELRNPLSTIRLNAELLAEELAEAGVDPGTEAQETLKSITVEVERLAELTEDYLRFARLPTSQPQVGDLNELVEAVVEFQRDELEAAGVEIELRLAEGLPPVQMDAAQLRRALLNLIRNAREAMEGGPRRALGVQTSADAQRVLLTIQDTGCGISEQVAARIFEPFFSTKSHGTGLGLPLTHQIIEEHGGTLACRSVVGEGTCFSISLPTSAP